MNKYAGELTLITANLLFAVISFSWACALIWLWPENIRDVLEIILMFVLALSSAAYVTLELKR